MAAAPTHQDGAYTAAIASSYFTKQTELAGVKDQLVGEQEFVQQESLFVAQAINAPHPDEADPTNPVWILTAEDNFHDLGEGIQQWTRRYARKPDAYSEMGGTLAYNFIGFYGTFGLNITAVTGRARFTEVVPVRIQRDFYITGPESYADYATPQEIPIIQEQIYYIGTVDQITDYLGDITILDPASTPTRTEYEATIGVGEFVAQPSKVERWHGNIYMRETFYIIAK